MFFFHMSTETPVHKDKRPMSSSSDILPHILEFSAFFLELSLLPCGRMSCMYLLEVHYCCIFWDLIFDFHIACVVFFSFLFLLLLFFPLSLILLQSASQWLMHRCWTHWQSFFSLDTSTHYHTTVVIGASRFSRANAAADAFYFSLSTSIDSGYHCMFPHISQLPCCGQCYVSLSVVSSICFFMASWPRTFSCSSLYKSSHSAAFQELRCGQV